MNIVTMQTIECERKHNKRLLDDCNARIRDLQKLSEEYRNKLNELDNIEKELEEYEKKPVSERTMTEFIFKDSGTVHIMDAFEDVNEKGFRRYERLIVENFFSFDENFGFNLVIERKGERATVGSITMTEFKQGYVQHLISHVKKEIRKMISIRENQVKDGEMIFFEVPYLLRAQNSSNRTGYGNVYNGEDLIFEGTLYGETTSYAFIGAKMIDIKKRNEEIERRLAQDLFEYEELRRKE